MKLSFVLAASFLYLSGCASILEGQYQNVTFNSNVPGAEVFIDGISDGATPYTGNIKKKTNTNLMVKKEGYIPQTITLSTSVDIVFWGNIICGGFIGSSTDYSTGAMYEYSPGTYYINLIKENETQEEKKTSRRIMKLREFTLMNYKYIVNDIKRGGGEYISTLSKMLDSRPSSQLTKDLLVLLDESTTRLEFFEKIISL